MDRESILFDPILKAQDHSCDLSRKRRNDDNETRVGEDGSEVEPK